MGGFSRRRRADRTRKISQKKGCISMFKRAGSKLVLVTGIVVFLLGLGIGGLGAWLVALGGTPYYLVAGIVLVISGILIGRGQAAGVWLYAGTLIGTIVWAISEAGLDGWALIPRLIAPAVLGLWIWSPWIAGRLFEARAVRARSALWMSAGGMIGSAAVIALVFAFGYRITAERYLNFGTAAIQQAAGRPVIAFRR
jgi:quinoprotein glucose dehydrogenase